MRGEGERYRGEPGRWRRGVGGGRDIGADMVDGGG